MNHRSFDCISLQKFSLKNMQSLQSATFCAAAIFGTVIFFGTETANCVCCFDPGGLGTLACFVTWRGNGALSG